MKVSDSYIMQGVQHTGYTQLPFANATIVADSGSSSNGIQLEISEKGKRMSHMMGKMEQMGPKMDERMAEMKSSIEDLGLEGLDLDSISDEEIEEVAQKIHEVMESYKSEHVEGEGFDITSLSSEDMKSYVSKFKNNASDVLESIGKMEGMMNRRPPMGGKPPVPPVGDQNQSALAAYNSLSMTTEEEEQLNVLEIFVNALEEDEQSTDETTNAFQQLIGEYLAGSL
ncbi:hypothetical protein ACNRWW_02910 [Metabacillus sp. HB246100]|uniref:hypothetical protein n=1 Tax=Bacillus weihaiensis TaxID=1547283 RepID=UPI0023575ACA|nr:hypothetical protein [Bacillus weihaiensis]